MLRIDHLTSTKECRCWGSEEWSQGPVGDRGGGVCAAADGAAGPVVEAAYGRLNDRWRERGVC